MEKNQEILLQKNEGAQLAHTVNQIHKILSSACKGGSEQVAKKASDFLSWLFFGDKYDDILSQAYRLQLLQSSEINRVVQKMNYYANESLKLQILGQQYQTTGNKNIAEKIGSFSRERGIFTEQGLVDIMEYFINKNIPDLPQESHIRQSGGDQMTVWVSKWAKEIIQNSAKEANEQATNLIKQNRRLRFAYKDVKIDTMAENPSAYLNFAMEDPEINNYLNCVYQVLSSASVKSKNKLERIDLEETTILKAYSAFINYSKTKTGITQREIKNLFTKYYKDKELEDDPYITAHLNHIISVYALTGLGTSLQSDLKSVLNGAKYLVAVDNINKKVIIHSTNRIINEILLKNNYSKSIISNVVLNLNRL